MEDFANSWRFKVQDSGRMPVNWGKAVVDEIPTKSESDYEFDEDDEDMDDDELDDYLQMMAESRAATQASIDAPLFVDNTSKPDEIVSPFAEQTSVEPLVGGDLELNDENVDKVLEEVRPYLISDGGENKTCTSLDVSGNNSLFFSHRIGNVSVQKVDAEHGNIYLKLEGACGSCASSTVTMKMGIERVLKEKFGAKVNDVIQVDPEEALGGEKPTELTMEVVQAEVKRLSQAIVAMGGVVNVVSVDPIGVVEIEFRGPNKVKKGLELALLDIDFVKHVNFVS
jgi:Fe-S cluster biogenesis protein NfuA